MNLNIHILKHLIVTATVVGGFLPTTLSAQNISQIAQSDPLIITGAIGTQNTYRYTGGNSYSSSPWSNMIYANLNISVYGIAMPFSLYYSNDNTSFSYPQISFNLTPSYGPWTGHIGLSSMPFSSYVMNMSYNGVGLEYNTNKIRAGAFYGKLRSAINSDPTDPYARTPQYKRMGWGFKAGYGTGRNYIDVYLLRAYDQPNSIDESWRRIIRPQENIVVGLRGCVTPLPWLSLSTNAAVSAFSSDTEVAEVETPVADRWSKIFNTRYSSNAHVAGDVNANIHLGSVNASVSYRYIQPDYVSLGTTYISNNYHSLGLNLSTQLFHQVSLTANFSGQEDNLSGKQLYTTRGLVYALNASSRIGNHFSIAAGFNGYTQTQRNGTAVVNDTTRVDRLVRSFSITPTYITEGTTLGHAVSLSFNKTENLDRNKIVAKRNDVYTTALGANYTLSVLPWDTDFNFSYSHQQTKGYSTRYTSDVGSLDVGRAFLEKKTLFLSAGVNMCYNHILRDSKSLSMGADVSASYTLNDVHVFSLNASLSKFGDVNMTDTRSKLDETEYSVSLNYAYTFSLIEIKKKH